MRHCTFGAMALTRFSLTLVSVLPRPLARQGLERAHLCPLQNLQSFPCHIYTAAKRVQTLEMERVLNLPQTPIRCARQARLAVRQVIPVVLGTGLASVPLGVLRPR